MKVTAVTKFKQGDLYNALKKLGWTQKELGKRAGIKQDTIGAYLNLRNKPSPSNITKIQKVFGKAGVFIDVLAIWPEDFKGFKKTPTIEQTKEVDLALLSRDVPALHDSMKPNLDDARLLLENAISSLPPREAMVLRRRYFDGENFSEIGKSENACRGRIGQIHESALRRLRKSALRVKVLREAMDCVT